MCAHSYRPMYFTIITFGIHHIIEFGCYLYNIEPGHEISNNLTSVDSDEPLQPPFKLRNSKWCSVSSLTIIEYSSDYIGSDQTARMRMLI